MPKYEHSSFDRDQNCLLENGQTLPLALQSSAVAALRKLFPSQNWMLSRSDGEKENEGYK